MDIWYGYFLEQHNAKNYLIRNTNYYLVTRHNIYRIIKFIYLYYYTPVKNYYLSDKGLMLEMSALLSLCGLNLTLINLFDGKFLLFSVFPDKIF